MEGRENKVAGQTSVSQGTDNPVHMNPGQIVVALPAFVQGNRSKRRNQKARAGSSGQGGQSSVALNSHTSSPVHPPTTDVTKKRPRGRPAGSRNKVQHKVNIKNSGKSLACAAEACDKFVCVEAGQDIFQKLLSFAEERRGPIFVYYAVGFVSSATILPLYSSIGGVKTHEGIYEILSFTGLLEPTEAGSPQASLSGVSGGLKIDLLKPDDGFIISGKLAGELIASNTVKLVLKVLPPVEPLEQNLTKENMDSRGAFDSTDCTAIVLHKDSYPL